MLDFVKQLFENNVISEQVRSEIETAWQTRIQENREQVTNELREEFARKYEHDKNQMVEATEALIADRLAAELTEFAEDRQGLIEARANYARKMKQDTEAMEAFVFSKLKQELAELHEDRQAVANNVAKIESFIVDSLAKEIAEFHADKRDLAETKVRLVKESKAKFEQVKTQFLKAAAHKINETVSNGIQREMTQLKEDIDAARKNDFGRRIFESFASEYAASYLNEKSETAKLLKVVEAKQRELDEAAAKVAQAAKLVESSKREIKRLEESAARREILGELLGPLKGEKREIMQELLESVQTPRLHVAFEKYLPAVMDGGKPAKRTLTESKAITGNKEAPVANGEEKLAEIVDIRRLAGL